MYSAIKVIRDKGGKRVLEVYAHSHTHTKKTAMFPSHPTVSATAYLPTAKPNQHVNSKPSN